MASKTAVKKETDALNIYIYIVARPSCLILDVVYGILTRMEWIRAHPYSSAICAIVLLLFGIFIIVRKNAAPATGAINAWSGVGSGFFDPTSRPATPQTISANGASIVQQGQGGPPYRYIPPPTLNAASASTTLPGLSDFGALIQALTQNLTPKTPAPKDDPDAIDAYAFIPSGLVNITAQQPVRTQVQQAVYEYGNEVGSYIQSYEDRNTAAINILEDHFEDRANPQKAAAVEQLANAIKGVGESLLSMKNVPPEMSSAHTALAKSYVKVGTNLALVTKAPLDADFLRAIGVYNASADAFITNFVSIATLFGAHSVNFGPTDTGSVFTFTATNL